MNPIDCFTNTNYQVLSCLYDHLGRNNISHITQREISDEVGLCLSFVNERIQELVKSGYVIIDKEHRGRYVLTERAVKCIEIFRQTNDI